jgi:hypothetical protein
MCYRIILVTSFYLDFIIRNLFKIRQITFRDFINYFPNNTYTTYYFLSQIK